MSKNYKDEVTFYLFWKWEYSRRNSEYINAFKDHWADLEIKGSENEMVEYNELEDITFSNMDEVLIEDEMVTYDEPEDIEPRNMDEVFKEGEIIRQRVKAYLNRYGNRFDSGSLNNITHLALMKGYEVDDIFRKSLKGQEE